ncbi:putative response regulatory protein [compost metagenome]
MYSILVVDDEAVTRNFLQANISLWNEHWEVRSAAMDGQEALDIMQTTPFDLVITDIKMPEMDGLELCRRISTQFPQQKMIILSGYDEFPLAQEAIRYGVNNYLLKPIVKEELIQALTRIEDELEQSSINELAIDTMKRSSEVTQKQVIKQFLAAIVTENDIEIKMLHPLMHRLEVNLIEADATIMVLSLDEHLLLNQAGYMSDSAVFRFIVRQMAEELAEEIHCGVVFNDTEQNVCVFMTGENEQQLLFNCNRLYKLISEALLQHTRLTITGAIGTPVSEILQLDVSYRHALSEMAWRLIQGTGQLYGYNTTDSNKHTQDEVLLRKINNCLVSISAAFPESDEWAYLAPLHQYIECIEPINVPKSQLYGISLIRYLEFLYYDEVSENSDVAIHTLKKLAIYNDRLIRENIMDIYKEALQQLRGNDHSRWDEQDIVARATAYIYEHYEEPISLAFIADKIGVSSAYLSSIFSQRHEEGYIKFLTRIRMEQAAKLLKHSNHYKIADIATKVGYLSSKHFSHVFKQHYGMPPGEFQEKNRSKKG